MAMLCLFIAGIGSGLARAESGPGATLANDDFEALRATLLEVETTDLCEQVRRCWKGLTLERALRAASSQEEALVEADAAGLLRGFVALMLHDKSCAEPPADVLAEATEYSRRFGWPASAPSDRLPGP
ncbi:MAG TPA: hypothetical protein VGS07_08195 [Thermoanaerobaculia bacterium]|jgi:hypothetical protein|nr:hypothetical protein [Thermoanaerobaculia bacterium]